MILGVATRAAILRVELPLRIDGDGSIVDAHDREICVVDPHCALPDDIVAGIGALLVDSVNTLAKSQP